ncbi:hypothetical protein ACGF12_35170 [Kitasatospora sp. NPDC048296]|uniref:hypothetical protein n=1 Tax=Kitasatospora sp. NPDC048296 TaxID=3364048 RepID=UPI003718CA39
MTIEPATELKGGGALRLPRARVVPMSAPPAMYITAVDRYLTGAGIAKSSARIYRISLTTWGWMLNREPAPTGPARRGAKPPGREDPLRTGPVAMDDAWRADEFVLDPCRLTVEISATGIDGDTFKHAQLMDRWGIQVNRTTRNTVLAMTNIGTTRSALAHLLRALIGIAEELEAGLGQLAPEQRRAFDLKVHSLAHDHPPLPDFSRFHATFRADPAGAAADGNMREAYHMAYREELCEFVLPEEARRRVTAGRPVVSAIFVTPYPPGSPILVPGQEFSKDILDFMDALDTKEIHGYDPNRGYRVFLRSALLDGSAPVDGDGGGDGQGGGG